jgi:LL-H family phage holin
MSDLTFEILKIAVICTVVIITTFFVPQLRAATKAIIDEATFKEIEKAVRAAEQVIRAQGQGKIKKEQVIERVTEWLKDRGYGLSAQQLSDLIEAAVYTMKQEQDAYADE